MEETLIIFEKESIFGVSTDKEPCTKRRFVNVSEEDLESCKKKTLSVNTQRTHQWAYNVFCEWIKLPREMGNYKEEDLWSIDATKVCNMLSKFVLEARQSNGKAYTPKTILHLMVNLQGLAFL